MDKLTEYKNLLQKTLNEIESYEKRQTKACSKRMRKLSLRLGKDGKVIRSVLLAADKSK